MPLKPCSPEELNRLADLLNDGELGKMNVTDIPIVEDTGEIKPGEAIAKAKMGALGHYRTMRGAMGDEWSATLIMTCNGPNTFYECAR